MAVVTKIPDALKVQTGTGSVTASGGGKQVITFDDPFVETPTVFLTTSQSSVNKLITVTYTALTNTGFTAVGRQMTSGSATIAAGDISFRWLAIGV